MSRLQKDHDEYHLLLEKVVATDLSSLSTDELGLRELSASLKSIRKSFLDASRSLSTKLITDGAVHEAQVVRETRSDIVKDAKELLTSINILLQDLGVEVESSFKSDGSVCSFSGSQKGQNLGTPMGSASALPKDSVDMLPFSNLNIQEKTPQNLLTEPIKSILDNIPDSLRCETPNIKRDAARAMNYGGAKPKVKFTDQTPQSSNIRTQQWLLDSENDYFGHHPDYKGSSKDQLDWSKSFFPKAQAESVWSFEAEESTRLAEKDLKRQSFPNAFGSFNKPSLPSQTSQIMRL